MRTNEPKTPLLALLRSLSADERIWLAQRAGTSVSYLYSLASCQRKPGAALALAIASASVELSRKNRGRSGAVSVEQLAVMCESCDL